MTTNNSINTGLSESTGSGSFVGSTSPTLATPMLGAATATSVTFSPTTGGIVGTTTNNNASAGTAGEYISSTILVGSAVSVTSTVVTNVTSISLTAGDWDVIGTIATNAAGATITSQYTGWISTTSASAPTIPNNGAYFQNSFASSVAGGQVVFPTGTTRISLSGTTTVYLSVYLVFTVSTMGAYGFIGARRAR